MSKDTRILIAIPVYQHAQIECMAAVYDLDIPKKVETKLAFSRGYTVVMARNNLVHYSLGEKFDYTFWIDSDIIVPKDALKRLLKLKAPIATGWYCKKIPGQQITELYQAQNGEMRNILEVKPDGPLPVGACGFGCTLVNNEVFREVGTELWFEYVQQPKGPICSEDLFFCLKAEKKGFKIVADSMLRCGHIGQVVF